MEFEIVLDKTKSVYGPGDVVQGTVLLDAKSDVAAREINIIFTGECKTRLKMGRSDLKSRAVLFQYEQNLYKANYTFSAVKRFEWPFSFTFPRTPQSRDLDFQFKQRDGWVYNSTCPLPPSFSYEDNKVQGTLQGDIEYKLEAHLLKPQTRFSLSPYRFRAKRVLIFAPARDEEAPIVQPSLKTTVWRVLSSPPPDVPFFDLHSLPPSSPQRRGCTTRRTVHSVFSSKSAASSFGITTSLPQQLIQGSTFPIRVKVDHLPQSSTTDDIPAVYLREMSLSATVTTSGRAEANFRRWISLESDEEQTLASENNLDMLLYDEITSLGPGTTPVELGRLFNFRCFLAPDFHGYNLKRTYTLRLKLVLQCGGETQEVCHEVSGFHVLPTSYSPPVPSRVPPSAPAMPQPHSATRVSAFTSQSMTSVPAVAPGVDRDKPLPVAVRRGNVLRKDRIRHTLPAGWGNVYQYQF
jgi:hypothetical protein